MPWWPLCTSCALRVMTRRQRTAVCASLSVLQPALMQQAKAQVLRSMAEIYCGDVQPIHRGSRGLFEICHSPVVQKFAKAINVASYASRCCPSPRDSYVPQTLFLKQTSKASPWTHVFGTMAFNSADKVRMSNYFDMDTFASLLKLQQL